jgi:hypothetical protein
LTGDVTSQRRWEAYDKLGTFGIYAIGIVLAIQVSTVLRGVGLLHDKCLRVQGGMHWDVRYVAGKGSVARRLWHLHRRHRTGHAGEQTGLGVALGFQLAHSHEVTEARFAGGCAEQYQTSERHMVAAW